LPGPLPLEQKDPPVFFPKSTNTQTAAANFLKHWPWIAVAIIVLFVAAIRIRLLQIPLERDEGEFAYMGQLMLDGIPPYLMAYNMKMPGIYAAYALLMAVFGQTTGGIHIGLMLVNATAVVLLFLIARRLFDNIVAVVAAASYALLSLSPSVLGTSAHATQFIIPLFLGGTLLLLQALGVCPSNRRGRSSLFISGLFYGLAFLIKQHAIFFVAFALIYYAWVSIRKAPCDYKKLASGSALLLFAAALPFGISCALLYAAGVFKTFWFWTFAYGAEYVTENSLYNAPALLGTKIPMVIKYWAGVWIIAGIGFTSVLWNRTMRSRWAFITGITLFSFLTICPGFYFRNHYFVTMLPAVALLAGIATSALMRLIPEQGIVRSAKAIPLLMIAAALMYPIVRYREFFFTAVPVRASQMMYGVSPFPDSVEVAAYIKKHTTIDDRIAVFGSEPQICFYAGRKSATGYIYMYPLMEPQIFSGKMQSDVIREIENARPRFAVRINVPNSWVRRTDSDPTIFHWADKYFGSNYRVAGFVDIYPDGRSEALWDDAARNTRSKSQFNIQVLERKSGLPQVAEHRTLCRTP
jgi:4-amino-4-deoxy-L-arabinose transferase-like glycosyltransferase